MMSVSTDQCIIQENSSENDCSTGTDDPEGDVYRVTDMDTRKGFLVL